MPRTRNSPNPRQKPSFFSLVNRWLQGGSDPYLFLFQSSIGSQFQPDEISSVMAADRTFFRHFCASVNMTALQTHPGSFYIRNKKFLLLQKVCKQPEPVSVGFLHSSDHTERSGDLLEAFFPGFFFKSFVYVFMLLKFIMLGKSEKLGHILGISTG